MFFIFTPKIGEMIQFDSYFSKGLKPPTSGAFEWLEAPTGIATDTGINYSFPQTFGWMDQPVKSWTEQHGPFVK